MTTILRFIFWLAVEIVAAGAGVVLCCYGYAVLFCLGYVPRKRGFALGPTPLRIRFRPTA